MKKVESLFLGRRDRNINCEYQSWHSCDTLFAPFIDVQDSLLLSLNETCYDRLLISSSFNTMIAKNHTFTQDVRRTDGRERTSDNLLQVYLEIHNCNNKLRSFPPIAFYFCHSSRTEYQVSEFWGIEQFYKLLNLIGLTWVISLSSPEEKPQRQLHIASHRNFPVCNGCTFSSNWFRLEWRTIRTVLILISLQFGISRSTWSILSAVLSLPSVRLTSCVNLNVWSLGIIVSKLDMLSSGP